MNKDEQGFRVTVSVFLRTSWVVAAAIPCFYLAAVAETEWMEKLSDDGVGSLYATAGIWAFFLLVFLPIMLWRFPRARLAATAGWALALLPTVGLYAWGHSLLYCQGCNIVS